MTSRSWRVLNVAFMALLSATSGRRASLKWGIAADERKRKRRAAVLARGHSDAAGTSSVLRAGAAVVRTTSAGIHFLGL
jgi:hypothetical protein